MKMLTDAMLGHAEQLEFEQAEQLRERLDHLERFQRRNTVVSTDVGDVDVFTIVADEGGGYVNYLRDRRCGGARDLRGTEAQAR